MAFAKASKKAEDVKQSGSNHITHSGMYPITILAPFVSVSNGGSESVDLYLNHAGQKQVLYGNLRITNNDGSANAIGSKIFNQLMIISGQDECADPVEQELPIGKNGKMKKEAVLEDLADIDAYIRIQMEYGIWNGKITEKKIIKSFYRASDMATAEEIVNDADIGKGFEADQKYVNNVTYNDDTTEEMIKQWIAAKRPDNMDFWKGDAPGGDSEDGSSEDKPAFGKKRFGK